MDPQPVNANNRKLAPSYTNPDPCALAIVGLSISAPGGGDHGLDTGEFYEFLKARGSGIITVPGYRWNAEAFHGTAPGKICTTKGGFIPNFTYGDLQEFGITPAEGAQVAVTQIALLHQAFNALQRSGIDYRGSNTGVYVGCAGTAFNLDITQAGAYFMTGTSLSINANRINYVFDLLGPSLPVDTACSSSLTAMHLAMQAVRNGECDQAIVAGVNIIDDPLETSSFSQLGVLSPDGISKSFDDNANGYARGDVASAVVIKRHDLAVRDCDHIHATLVGSALTSCGSIMGSLTTPSPQAQAKAIRNAFRDAGLAPHQVDFVELHGTGTVVGDAFEANAAGEVFSDGREGKEIVVGSVKSNIGHGGMGAFMSSLVKVSMMLERKQILPNGYFKKPSSRIEFDKFNLRVPVKVEDMVAQDPELGLIASISSFGFGGSCGHVVLREHEARPTLPDIATLQNGPFLFAVGGLSPKACNTLAQRYRDQYTHVDPLTLSAHLGSRARQMPWRTCAVANSLEEAVFPDPSRVEKRPNPLVFCFSGQGPQHWQQGRELFTAFSVFRESIYACDKVHEEYTGGSFLQETGLFISNPPKTSSLAKQLTWPADVISVGISFFQIALFDLLTAIGIKPDVIVGHSIGETAVLYASGAMPRSIVVKIAVARGRALAMVDNIGGAMVAISGCDASAVRDHIEAAISLSDAEEGEGKQLYVAAFNSPTDIGVSGGEALVDVLTSYIEKWVDSVVARKLRVSTAVHSPFVDPCQEKYRADLSAIFSEYSGPYLPTTLTMSTVTAEFKDDGYTIDYLWNNLREPVLFSTAVEKIMNKFGEQTTFVEMSPHPVLSQYIKQMGAFDAIPGSMRPPSARHLKPGVKPPTEVDTLLQAIGRLLLCGINSVNFAILTGCPTQNLEGLPYPFQMKLWPFALRGPESLQKILPPTRPLNSTRLRVSPQLPAPWIADHVIDHSNLIPAAAYVEMALEFPGVTHIWDCRFENAYILDDSAPPGTLEVSKEGNNWWVKSSSALQSMQGDLEWTRSGAVFDMMHSYGKLGYGKPVIGPNDITHVDVEAVLARCIQTHDKAAIYAEVEGIAQFGPDFQRLNKMSINETEAICWIRGHVDEINRGDYVFHPAVMDAVFQSTIAWALLYEKVNVGGKDRLLLLPHSLRYGFRNDGSTTPLNLPDEFVAYAVLTSWSAHHHDMDLYVLAEDGTVLFTFQGFHFALVDQGNELPTERYMMSWQPRVLPATHDEGLVYIEDTQQSETFELLQFLDKLALHYTSETINSLPIGFEPSSLDRKLYLSWAKALIPKDGSTVDSLPNIPTTVMEKYASLFELTQRVGERQKDIMVDSTTAVEILFRDDIMSRIYEHPPFVGAVFGTTVEQFIKTVKLARDAGKRVIRVLEVGAGTGRLTALLGQALIDAKMDETCYIDYVSTDISISLAQESISKSPWPTISAATFDLSLPIDQQKIDPSSFDIIVAFDVLHATPSIQDTLTTLHELLLPGGHLVIIELDGNSFATASTGTIWMDFIFGSFREWMGVLSHRAGSTHCTLTRSEWEESLKATGYSDILFLASSGNTLAHMSFVCQSVHIPSSCHRFSPLSSTPELSSGSVSHNTNSVPATPPDIDNDTTMNGPSSLIEFKKMLTGKDTVDLELSFSASPGRMHSSMMAENGSATDAITVHRYVAGDEVQLVSFLSRMDATKSHTFWLYTDTQICNATFLGLIRSIRHEFGMWKFYAVLFDASWDPSRQECYIYEQLIPLDWVDAEIIVDKDGNISVPRIVKAPSPSRTMMRGSNPIRFDRSHIWRAYPAELGPDDVEVTVAFMSLSPAFQGCSEFSGYISAVGENIVKDDVIGERVCGVLPSIQGSIIVCSRSKVSRIPDELNMASAAAVIGRLLFVESVTHKAIQSSSSKTPRVLLHAGICSPAAIATYAFLKTLSLDVLVTISNQVSQAQLDSLPSSETFTAEEYRVWSFITRERFRKGVDVAFDFSEDMNVTKETIQLLSRRGTLVQIGGNRSCQVHPGQQFISVDYNSIAVDDGTLDDDLDMLHAEVPKALIPRIEIYEMHQFTSAQEKACASSTADISILLDLEHVSSDLPVLQGGVIRSTEAFNPRATYVIIGGIGGLGASLARFLVENGARHIVLTSRSGEKTFATGRLVREKKIISYLRETPGVTVDLAAVDCLDAPGTMELFASLTHPVAGVFYIPVRLNDQLFTNLTTEEDWKTVYDVKIKGLEVLLEVIDPKSLDFLVLASSMATVSGSPGQANYAAAQTQMEAIGTTLPNTVSITVPPITDGGIFVRSMPSGNGRNAALDKYKALGMSGMRVAGHCLDAIWSITDGSSPVYIPPMNWKNVLEIGVPEYHQSSMRHLLVNEASDATRASGPAEQTIRSACATVLSLKVEDVEDTIPLSSYGLDSLTSVRLSGVLKTYFDITVTQLQLLSSHTTVERLNKMQEEQNQPSISDSNEVFDASKRDSDSNTEEMNMDKTLVRLNKVESDRILFLLHGAGGGIQVMAKLAQRMKYTVFGIQDTPEAPLTGTLEMLSRFYLEKIKEKQSEGPYLLGGFSFGTCLAVNIAQILQTAGEKVNLLVMLDGAPTLFHRPTFRDYTRRRIAEGTLRDDIMDVISDMSQSGTLDDVDDVIVQFADHFSRLAQGGSGPKWVARFCKAYVAHILMGIRVSLEISRKEKAGAPAPVWPTDRTVLVRAKQGMSVQPYAEGASRLFDLENWVPGGVDLYEVEGTHFGILNPDSGLAEILNDAVEEVSLE